MATYRSVAVAIGDLAACVGISRESPGTPNEIVATLFGNGDDEAITSEPSEEQDPTPPSLPQ